MNTITHHVQLPDTLEAWQQALAEVPQTPALTSALVHRRANLLGRFTEWYQRLRSRPRAERRRLQRKLGLSLAGIALLLAVNGATAAAVIPSATITVSGACDLIEAIGNANDTTTGHPNTDCAAGDPAGADMITLGVDVTLATSNNSLYGATGLPVITSAITIQGNGHTISRQSGSPAFRILAMGSGGNLTVNSAAISGGSANYGGGIYNQGTLTVQNSTLSGNSASNYGGGIHNRGTLTVQNSTLSGNSAGVGGGINNYGTLKVQNSTLSGNSAGGGGGGIENYSGVLMVQNSTLSGNSAGGGRGGGIDNSGTLTVQNSTISGNSVGWSGTCGFVYSNCYGGGIFNYGVLIMENSTISGNSALWGGGISNGAGGSFGTLVVQNSIVAMQVAGEDCFHFNNTPSLGYNIESATSCGFNQIGDLQNTDPLLAALASNGGPTQTRALGAGSPAIDKIPVGVNGCAAGTSTDQRAAPRAGGTSTTGGSACDVGAYERSSMVTLTVSGACDLIEAIGNANDTTTGQPNTDCAAGNPAGADTIDLQVNATLTVVNNSTYGNNGLPVVTSAITVDGNGNSISRQSGSPDFRILAVGSGGNLTLNSATISGGIASGTFPANIGGGIYFGNYASGTVSHSTLSGNSAYGGGGIEARGSTVTVSNSTLSGNAVERSGGGIEAAFGSTLITNSTLSGNTAGVYGGGIMAAAGTVTVTNSTLSGNTAGLGGGIAFRSALATVQNSTLSGNSASSGGGINSHSSTVTVQNSIVALQTAGGDCTGNTLPTSGGHNIASGTSCGFIDTGDLQNVTSGSLALGGLASNGGPTETRALGFGSVALDHIPVGALEANGCGVTVTVDQRGLPRAGGLNAGGTACDVGAYEAQTPPLAVTLADFAAQAMIDHILLTWETSSEINNSGFNLYRSAAPATPDELLAFVPSQAPGSTQGASYSFVDEQVTPGQTMFYWLEDVDLSGATTLHGPVSATIQAPTAVTVTAMEAQAASPAGNASAWGALVAGLIGVAGALGVRRRSRAG